MVMTNITAPVSGKALHPDQVRVSDQVKRQTGRQYNALAALLVAVPVAAIMAAALVARFDLHWAWGIPLYGLSGAILVGVIVSVVDFKRTC